MKLLKPRHMTKEDMDSVLALSKKVGGPENLLCYWDLTSMNPGESPDMSFVVEDKDKIIGFVKARLEYVFAPVTEVCLIHAVVTDPDYRGRGIAAMLLQELIEKFSLRAVGRSAAAINPGKLDWLNAQYIKKMPLDELAGNVRPLIEQKGYSTADPDLLKKSILSFRERVKTLVEMADLSEFYFREEVVYEENAAGKFLKGEAVPVLEQIIASLSKEETLDKQKSHQVIQQVAESRGEPLVKVAQPVRIALTGRAVSPPIDEVMDTLGKKETIRRLRKAIEHIKIH